MMADTMGHTTDRILAHEHLRLHEQQVARLNQSMQDSLVATDRVSLLTQFKTILDEQFGLRRVFIALVNANANALRCELHSGFETLFIPTTIALDNEKNHFVELLRLSQVQVYESARGNFTDALSAFGEGPGAERAVVIPLCDGRRRPIGFIYVDQPLNDGQPIFPEALAILARLAAASIENLELRRLADERAETDPLTGLRNRFYMDRVLDLEIPRVKRYSQPLSLLMIDLCDFKRTNDTYGHLFGDYILKETAHLIEGNVRRPDVVIRYGGDEFVVLMVNTSAEQAELVRRRIEEAFIERNRLQTDTRTMINISLGLRLADADSIASLLHDVDMAMYAEKARQRRRNLITALIEGNAEKIEAADRVVSSLCNMLYRKAPYYHDHALRVTHLALRIGPAGRIGRGTVGDVGPGRLASRRGEGVDPDPDPAKNGTFHAGRTIGDAEPSQAGRGVLRGTEPPRPGAADHPQLPRTLRRRTERPLSGLSRRPSRRAHPARGPHPEAGRKHRRDTLRPPVSAWPCARGGRAYHS